jgi:hypothetical protein
MLFVQKRGFGKQTAYANYALSASSVPTNLG